MRLLFLLLSFLPIAIAEAIIRKTLNIRIFKSLIKRTSFYKISLANLSNCFRGKSKIDIEDIALKSTIESIISLYETVYSWSRSEACISQLVFKQENRFMLQDKSPKLVYSLHNRSIDLLLSFFTLQNSATILYKTIKNNSLNNYVIKRRSKNNSSVATASIGGVKAVIKSLKANKDVCFASDQVPPHGLGVNSYLFNNICYSSSLVESISSRDNINTCFVYLTKNMFGYVVSCNNLSGQPVTTNLMNKVFEEAIILKPEEYAWEYKKFRRIPENKDWYIF